MLLPCAGNGATIGYVHRKSEPYQADRRNIVKTFIRLQAVREATGLSTSTIYEGIREYPYRLDQLERLCSDLSN